MRHPEQVHTEQQMLEDVGVITYDPSFESAPAVLSHPAAEAEDAVEIGQTVRLLNIALDSLVKHYSPQERAIGLAAPQLGIPTRIAAIQEADSTRRILINPTILSQSEATEPWRIGCLSLSDYRQISNYPKTATIEYQDESGQRQQWQLSGDDVVVPVHELEHLNGKLLTDRATDALSQLFVPREVLFGSRILVRNWAASVALKRLGNLPVHVQTTEQYYSSLFRGEAVDWSGYVDSHVTKRKELVDVLLAETPPGGKVFEAGCGTSALSVYLSQQGYDVTCIDNSPAMLTLAQRCNQALGSSVTYEPGDLFKTGKEADTFDLVFSHGVLEEVGGPDDVVAAIDEALRIGRCFVFSVPTIWDRSNNLNGTENLWTVQKWKRIIQSSRGNLKYTKGGFPLHPKLAHLNQKTNGALNNFAANVIFCIERSTL